MARKKIDSFSESGNSCRVEKWNSVFPGKWKLLVQVLEKICWSRFKNIFLPPLHVVQIEKRAKWKGKFGLLFTFILTNQETVESSRTYNKKSISVSLSSISYFYNFPFYTLPLNYSCCGAENCDGFKILWSNNHSLCQLKSLRE